MGAGEFWKEVFRFIAASFEAVVESTEVLGNDIGIGAQRVDPMAVAKDEAVKYSWRMCGVGRDEEVQVQQFLEEGSADVSTVGRDSDV